MTEELVVRVKICGVTRRDDIEIAVDAGADAIGLNLWPGSRRYVSPEVASDLRSAIPARVLAIGVFVDAAPEEVISLADRLGLDRVQLHGSESPAVVERVGPRALKAFRLVDAGTLTLIEAYPGDELLVDAHVPGMPGGTGRPANRALARRAAGLGRMWLAGGLDPSNVAEAVREVRPYGVDVAGGVESAPGIKDEALVRAFVRAARSA